MNHNATNDPEPEDVGLLENCPRCGYALHGLPIAHACPECGLAFNRRWHDVFGGEWNRAPSWQLWLEALLSVDPALTLLALAIGYFSAGWLGLCGGACLVFIICSVFYLSALSSSKAEGFVALGPDGVDFRSPREKVGTCLPWASIRRARAGYWRRSLKIQTDEKKLEICAEHYFGNRNREIRRCARAINRYLASIGPRR